jgi:uncharacterized membrane protein
MRNVCYTSSIAMPTLYNRLAAHGLERLTALSDGIFAFAMTLLVLDIRVPPLESVHGERDLWLGLVALVPRFVMYLMSFLTLGIFWVGQQTQLDHLARSDRDLAWLHIAFLASVAMLPFSTTLLAEYITYRTALLVYWGNIAVIGVMIYACWRHATRATLIKADAPAELDRAIMRRVVVAQALYAFGAALCLINTYCSIAFIVLVQLNYAIAPRFTARWGT